MRRLILLLATIGVAVLLASGAALAITYGQNDGTKHPNVGALVDEDGEYCSGTLVQGAPNSKYNPTGAPVFLTADHCYPLEGNTSYITFDPTYTQGSSREYRGRFIDDPQWYRRGHDIAVVVFDNPGALPNVRKAQLPETGSLSNLSKGQKFTAVGYGVDQTLANEGVRRYAVSSLTSQNSYYLSLSQQQKKSFAGTCYGDSGGPNFLGAGSSETDINAALTNTGDAMCKSKNTVLRLDTQAAYNFLVGEQTATTADDYVSSDAFVPLP